MKVKVAKWGNSLGVRLPKAAAEAIGAVDGADLELIVEGRSLKLVPQMIRSGDLMKKMLDEIEQRGLTAPPLVDWGPDVGSEIIDDDYSRGLIVPGPDGAPVRIDKAAPKQESKGAVPVHDAGDIVWADLEPIRGTEQGKRRPALILTSRRYNELSGRAVICPITSRGGDWPFNVLLPDGMETHGVVLVDQVRAVHRESRLFRPIEKAPLQLLIDVRIVLSEMLGIDPGTLQGSL